MEVSIVMGVPKMAGLFHGKSHSKDLKWMMTGGTPILGNLQIKPKEYANSMQYLDSIADMVRPLDGSPSC